jgi:hypothetical protein
VFQALIKNVVDKIVELKFASGEWKPGHRIPNLVAVEHSTRKDKESRILNLVPWIKNGQIKINNSFDDLINELLMYPKWHDDLLDALEEVVKKLTPAEVKDGRTEQEKHLQLLYEATISHNPDSDSKHEGATRYFRGFIQ